MRRRRRAGAERARRRIWRGLLRLTAFVVLASAGLVLPWRWLAPPTTAFMLLHRLEHGQPPDYRWKPAEEISPQLALAVLAAEDQKFADHPGFDFASIRDALREARPRGASTLSQQVAKNLFLWPGRSYLRKVAEAWLTAFLELLWPKARILEVYLNVAEFGPGIYGAEAAARRFFARPASQLSAEQAARLAAVLPSPRRMSPVEPSPYVRQRAAEIRDAMRKLGGLDHLDRLGGARP